MNAINNLPQETVVSLLILCLEGVHGCLNGVPAVRGGVIYKLDPITLDVKGTIYTDESNFGLVVNAAGDHLYVTNSLAAAVSKVELNDKGGIQRLLQGIEHEVGMHGTADALADNPAGKYVDDEGHIQPTLPGRYIGKIRHPQLIGPLGLELAIDMVLRARSRSVGDSGAHRLPASGAMDTKTSH